MTPAVTRMAKTEAYSFANNLSTCLLVYSSTIKLLVNLNKQLVYLSTSQLVN